MLAQVNKDIATVQSEQRKHLQQWQSSLLKVHKQEAAMKVGLVTLVFILSTWAMHVFTEGVCKHVLGPYIALPRMPVINQSMTESVYLDVCKLTLLYTCRKQRVNVRSYTCSTRVHLRS